MINAGRDELCLIEETIFDRFERLKTCHGEC